MKGHPYKQIYINVNESRRKRGLKPLTWLEFMKKEDTVKHDHRGRPRVHPPGQKKKQVFFYNFDDDEPPKEPLKRPPAVYDNKSPYDKYGI